MAGIRALQTSKAIRRVGSQWKRVSDLINHVKGGCFVGKTVYKPVNLAHEPKHEKWASSKQVIGISSNGVQSLHKPLRHGSLVIDYENSIKTPLENPKNFVNLRHSSALTRWNIPLTFLKGLYQTCHLP